MKTRTGKVLLVFAISALGLGGGSVCWAAGKGKKEKKPSAAAASPAILGGTVFSGAGFALRGAEVLITRTEPPPGKERWKTVTDARGEFFVRLPAGPAKYNVSVRAPGSKPQEKEIAFIADERLEQNFLLDPAPGSKK